jgi:hypothetical protein
MRWRRRIRKRSIHVRSSGRHGTRSFIISVRERMGFGGIKGLRNLRISRSLATDSNFSLEAAASKSSISLSLLLIPSVVAEPTKEFLLFSMQEVFEYGQRYLDLQN